jgi:hypothetical protein
VADFKHHWRVSNLLSYFDPRIFSWNSAARHDHTYTVVLAMRRLHYVLESACSDFRFMFAVFLVLSMSANLAFMRSPLLSIRFSIDQPGCTNVSNPIMQYYFAVPGLLVQPVECADFAGEPPSL